MTVNYNDSAAVLMGHAALWSQASMVDGIARAAFISNVEAYVDMFIDTQTYATDRAAVVAGLSDVRHDTAQMVSELMDSLKKAVLERLAEQSRTITVTRMDWDTEGAITDIVIDVTFN